MPTGRERKKPRAWHCFRSLSLAGWGVWRAEGKNLKRYPHFDAPISPTKLENLVRDPAAVARHQFFPFLLYVKSFVPFRPSGKAKKERKIRYAARRDAAIFSYYRALISEAYEKRLSESLLEDSVIAYRKIAAPHGGGKCNIDYAKEGFDFIREAGNCVAVALDIKSYFEKLDHERLRAMWLRVLEISEMPKDHETVFKAITRYAEVDRTEVYRRLGFIGAKPESPSEIGYLVDFDEFPKQLCPTSEFRAKVAGKDSGYSNIIQVNKLPYGIPQGAPISDVLANIYLLDFDAEVANYARTRGGIYRRYSDDLLVIIPGTERAAMECRDYITNLMPTFGTQLAISEGKTCATEFSRTSNGLHFRSLKGGKNGFEYLGFRFDGSKVYLRDNTLTNFDRRIRVAAKSAARAHALRYRDRDVDQLLETFNYEEFEKSFGKVEEFSQTKSMRDWTFWTYVKRATRIFGEDAQPIVDQVKGHRKRLRERVREEIRRAKAH